MDDSTPRTIEIPLTRGYTAIVDEQDADLLAYKWHASANKLERTLYARRSTYINRKNGTVLMHQTILERILGRKLCKGELVDHKNHIGTDNTRKNLRLADNQSNTQNRQLNLKTKNSYKGVSQELHGYSARINVNKKTVPLGRFETVLEAACAYNAAAVKYFGEFAYLNPIENWQQIFENSRPIVAKKRQDSGYKGVHMGRDKWEACISQKGRKIHLGCFDTPEQANEARLNFIARQGL